MTRDRRRKAAVRKLQDLTGSTYSASLRKYNELPSFEQVLDNQPQLTFFGFGVFYDRRESAAERQREFLVERAELLQQEAHVTKIRDWLLQNIAPIKTPRQGSYGVKHVVERAMGTYVSNGELIAAALMADYPMARPHGNVDLGMSQRDLDRAREG
ncbi:hypothetical protein [Haloechinothrix salitolerans]|uniref:Uncharacterized protein n=1 Tax=Haloechinothrix salitolerans TaxID=926830 RepID=A0ABW2BVA6_9PSEU